MIQQKLNFSRSALFHMKTRVSLKYFVNDCFWKHFFASNSPHTSSNLISLTIVVTIRLFASFKLKLEQLSCKKVLNFALRVTAFPIFLLR